eukprot:TRINITY_DN1130_c0_g2_i1.p1 TRINITY_DN1130_c0_g2~~TRINITY_DN1130_c0_g2_i1.p1  ORF type:complete len:221 (-),score=11.53 TRINITY_DN1130_c0_g2_i1:218-808(-)
MRTYYLLCALFLPSASEEMHEDSFVQQQHQNKESKKVSYFPYSGLAPMELETAMKLQETILNIQLACQKNEDYLKVVQKEANKLIKDVVNILSEKKYEIINTKNVTYIATSIYQIFFDMFTLYNEDYDFDFILPFNDPIFILIQQFSDSGQKIDEKSLAKFVLSSKDFTDSVSDMLTKITIDDCIEDTQKNQIAKY